MGDESFGFGMTDMPTTIHAAFIRANGNIAPPASASVLRVTVAGGGPVGLSLALLLEHLMGSRVAIKVYDSRWLGKTVESYGRPPTRVICAASRS